MVPTLCACARHNYHCGVVTKLSSCRTALGEHHILFISSFCLSCLHCGCWAGWTDHKQEVIPNKCGPLVCKLGHDSRTDERTNEWRCALGRWENFPPARPLGSFVRHHHYSPSLSHLQLGGNFVIGNEEKEERKADVRVD